jgi:hypothetical protein
MKVMFQGKEIELEEATDEEMSLDYMTPTEPYMDENMNLEDTIEITPEMQDQINGDQNG